MPQTGGKRRGTRHAKKRSTRRMRKGTRKMKGGIFGFGGPNCTCEPDHQKRGKSCVKFSPYGEMISKYELDSRC